MIPVKANFFGGVNTDVSPHLMRDGQYITIDNGRLQTSDNGEIGVVSEIGGTLALTAPRIPVLPDYKREIGSAEDPFRNMVIFFRYDSTGDHDIIAYNLFLNVFYTIARGSFLGFLPNKRIQGAHVVGDQLFWNDDNKPPRRINIPAGIKSHHPSYVTTVLPYTLPIDDSIISVLRNPPAFPVSVAKQFNALFSNNFIGDVAIKFAWRFVYRDGEESVFSVPSNVMLTNVNSKNNPEDNFNYVKVDFPLNQTIPQDVEVVELAAMFDLDSNYFVIKRWDRTNNADLLLINDHSSGIQALTHDFYNDIAGDAVAETDSIEPFHDVPELAVSQSVARNRVYYGKPVNGKSKPATSIRISGSMTLQSAVDDAPPPDDYPSMLVRFDGIDPLDPIPGTYQPWGSIRLIGAPIEGTTYTVMAIDTWQYGYTPFLMMEYIVQPGDSIDTVIAGLIASNASNAQLTPQPVDKIYIDYLYIGGVVTNNFSISYVNVSGVPVVSPISSGSSVFKSGASFTASLIFFDEGLRNAGVMGGGVTFETPDRTFISSQFATAYVWNLINDVLTANEIPDWAVYYAPCITLNSRTRTFVEMKASAILYRDKNGDDVATYSDTHTAVALDVNSLLEYGMGYTYSEANKDVVYIWLDSSPDTKYTIRVIGQDGSIVLCQMKNLGNLTGRTAMFEIFTPYRRPSTELFYEQGQVYPILDAKTATRRYSTTAGSLTGDVRILKRDAAPNSYFVQAMNANDLVWKSWFTNIGRPNVIFKSESKRRNNIIQFSEKLIPGTKINGLSRFTVGNEAEVPNEAGPIAALMLTTRVQQDGSMMLAICSQHTVSIYLGEQMLRDNAGDTYLVQSQTVIGTMNVMRFRAGTAHHSTVQEHNGNVFWYDMYQGLICRYGGNGVYAVSRDGMSIEMKRYSDLLMNKSEADLELLDAGQVLEPIAGIDPYHREYYLHLPTVSLVPAFPDLEDYDVTTVPAQMEYPYTVLNNRGTVLVYKIGDEDSKGQFIGKHQYRPDCFGIIGSLLFSGKAGEIYLHNQDQAGLNEFYGDVVPMRIASAVSPQLQTKTTPKAYQGIAVESNRCPSFIHFRTERNDENSEYVQSSDLIAADISMKEGVWYGPIMRDRFSPNVVGGFTMKQNAGDKMRGPFLKFMVEFSPVISRTEVKFVSIIIKESFGHKI